MFPYIEAIMLRRLYRKLRKHLLHPLIPESRSEIFADGKRGVEVVGFFHSASGIGESARLCALQLQQSGIKVRCTSVEKMFGKPQETEWKFADSAELDEIGCRIFHLNPPMMPPVAIRMGLSHYARIYNIGYWAWELEEIPVEWTRAIRYVNAICCPSEFTAQTLRKYTRKPVITVPHPVTLGNARPNIRAYLGLADDAFVVTTLFSFGSALERKNPYAAVAAFVAVCDGVEDAWLILKSSHGGCSAAKQAFLDYIQPYSRVRLIDDVWEKDQVLGLIQAADVYLSLHRSEGFGLPIAEAMLAGTPVVVTDWSGSRDFCDADNSFPVPYRLIPVQSSHPEFAGLQHAQWADPDHAAAAATLRRIYTQRDTARAKAARCLRETNAYFAESRYVQALDTLNLAQHSSLKGPVQERGMAFDKLALGNFTIVNTTAQNLATHLLDGLARQRRLSLFFANTNFVVNCRALADSMRNDAVLIVNDGVGMDLAAWLINRRRFKANLNGTDFTPYLLRQAQRPLRIFLLGGTPEVVKRAAEHARQQLGQEVVGVGDGYAGMRETDLLTRIAQSQADLLLVALGNPIQEQWILQHRNMLEVPLVMGVGALFDFWAGNKPRAPRLVQSLRLEWFYRLCLEPRRLLRRYTVDIVRFFFYCHRYR